MSDRQVLAEFGTGLCIAALAFAGVAVPGAAAVVPGAVLAAWLWDFRSRGDKATVTAAISRAVTALRDFPDFSDNDIHSANAYLQARKHSLSIDPEAMARAAKTGDLPAALFDLVTDMVRPPEAGAARAIRLTLDAVYAVCRMRNDYHTLFTQEVLIDLLKNQINIQSMIDRLLADKDAKAQELGLAQGLVIGLARRIAEDVADFPTAMRELERALPLAARLHDQAVWRSNIDDQVEEIMRELSALNDENRLDEGADLIAAELARIDAKKARLYDAAIDQDILRRNAPSAARWLVERLKAENPPDLFEALRALWYDWHTRGRDGGLNFEAEAAIHLANATHAQAVTPDQRGIALNDLGVALSTLGEREASSARLEEAVATHRAALEEIKRGRVPLDWAMAQRNLGSALMALGQREPNTARLKQAVAAYRAALEVHTRDHMPPDWAVTQMNLAITLHYLSKREHDQARLEEAVTAFQSVLEVLTRATAPQDWARTQMNLGHALLDLGQRETGTARLEEAVSAHRAALEVRTRDSPLDWAMSQMNLGLALLALNQREFDIARSEEAVTALRAALEERTRDLVPLDWAMTQASLGHALLAIGQREPGTERLEQAVTAYRAALEVRNRDIVPMDWADAYGMQGVAMIMLANRALDPAVAEK